MLNKKTMRVGLVICMLVVIASVCRDLNVDSILRSTTGIFDSCCGIDSEKGSNAIVFYVENQL